MSTLVFAAGMALTLGSMVVVATIVRMLVNVQRHARLQGITKLVPIPLDSALIIGAGLFAFTLGILLMAASFA
jgi:hypothetical protein